MMTINERLSKAIQNTQKLIPGYFEKTLETRLQGGVGSVTDFKDADSLKEALETAHWEYAEHSAIAPECTGIVTEDIPGEFGLKDLEVVPEDTLVTMRDRKGTGKVSLEISGTRGKRVNYTFLILGPEQGEEVVFTFHPGAPIPPSYTKMEPGMDGKQITVKEALEMGFKTAKIV